MPNTRALSDEDEARAAEMYRQGERARDIAAQLATTPYVINHALRRQGVVMRPKTIQRKFGPEHACSRCHVITTTTTTYCLDCAREYRKGYVNGKSLRGGDCSRPPPPPPGTPGPCLEAAPYGSQWAPESSWEAGTRPFGVATPRTANGSVDG